MTTGRPWSPAPTNLTAELAETLAYRCAHCREPLRGLRKSGYCPACRAAYRAERPAEKSPEELFKDGTRAITKRLIRLGKLAVKPCACGAAAEAHHPDYDRPALVVWVCRRHHTELHRLLRHAPDRPRFCME